MFLSPPVVLGEEEDRGGGLRFLRGLLGTLGGPFPGTDESRPGKEAEDDRDMTSRTGGEEGGR